jgi:glutathione S-transferase
LPTARGGKTDAVELYQAEWCPHSHKVRQRLTELGIDFMARQVPADPDERMEIPVLVTDDGGRIQGEDEILAYLDRFAEPTDAGEHKAKSKQKVESFEA